MRRPIASRDTNWARQIAKALAGRGITPNFVSSCSVLFAAIAAFCLSSVPSAHHSITQAVLCGTAALCIQLRLLCNLFDGMLAVEFGKASALGPIWNDFPDRPADVLILVGCGFSGGFSWLPALGWIAASLALLTAYTRVLGSAIGGGEHFIGPMAKQQRMAVMTVACVLTALEVLFHWPQRVIAAALIVVVLGCVITVLRRLKLIAQELEAGTQPQSTLQSPPQ